MKKKTGIKATITLLLFGFLTLTGIAQVNEQSTANELHVVTEEKEQVYQKAAAGTYLLIAKSKLQEVFTTQQMNDILILVESNRDNNEDKRIQISEHTEVLILSRKKINNPNFVPLEQTLFYNAEK